MPPRASPSPTARTPKSCATRLARPSPTTPSADVKYMVDASGNTLAPGAPLSSAYVPPAQFWAYLDQFVQDEPLGKAFASEVVWKVSSGGGTGGVPGSSKASASFSKSDAESGDGSADSSASDGSSNASAGESHASGGGAGGAGSSDASGFSLAAAGASNA